MEVPPSGFQWLFQVVRCNGGKLFQFTKEGMAISTEVLDAQTLLTRAKVDRQNAIYDLAEAQYRLLDARGELLDFLAPRITAVR